VCVYDQISFLRHLWNSSKVWLELFYYFYYEGMSHRPKLSKSKCSSIRGSHKRKGLKRESKNKVEQPEIKVDFSCVSAIYVLCVSVIKRVPLFKGSPLLLLLLLLLLLEAVKLWPRSLSLLFLTCNLLSLLFVIIKSFLSSSFSRVIEG